jgi:hypothetical protein
MWKTSDMKAMKAGSGKDVVRTKSHNADHRYAARLALLTTVRDLRTSVTAGRPMTLPNCLRLCRRRLAGGNSDSAVLELLASIYRKHQPFRRGPHVIRVRDEE